MAGKSVTLEIEGLERVGPTLQSLGKDAPKALAASLFQRAERIMTKSKLQVPVDTGALRSTGHVRLPERDGSKVTVTLGYGGPAGKGGNITPGVSPKTGRESPADVGYAVFVHEDMSARHPVGKSKYLEDPVKEATPTLGKNIANDLSKVARRLARKGRR